MFILISITNKKKKANSIYKDKLINSTLNYDSIIKCIYLGGQEYENNFLNNDKARDIILEKEKAYNVTGSVNVSIIRRLTNMRN